MIEKTEEEMFNGLNHDFKESLEVNDEVYKLSTNSYLALAEKHGFTKTDIERFNAFQNELILNALKFSEGKKIDGDFDSLTVNALGFTWVDNDEGCTGYQHKYTKAYDRLWHKVNQDLLNEMHLVELETIWGE